MRTALQSLKTVNGSITATFQQVGEGKVQYSHRQHTKSEARYVWLRACLCQRLSEKLFAVQNLFAGSQRTIDLSK